MENPAHYPERINMTTSPSLPSANPEDTRSIAAWFDRWGPLVAGCQFESARELFASDVVGFGTYMDLVDGLDSLEARQWRSIWPTIADFRFVTENLRAFVASDRCLATAMVVWTSTGFDENKKPYDRPGRTTAVLKRDSISSPWLGVHTHFSEFPAETKRTFDKPGEASGE